MARTLALLFGAGATFVVLTLALPLPDQGNGGVLVAAIAVSYLAAGGLLWRAGDLAPAALAAVVVLGTLLVGVCVTAGGEAASAYAYMDVWVSLYAYAFFRARVANLLVGFCAVVFALSVGLQAKLEVPVAHVLLGIGSFGVAGVLLGRLAEAIRARAADLEAVARLSAKLGDVEEAVQAACRGLQASAGADAVVYLTDGGSGLRIDGLSGTREAAAALTAPAEVRAALEACLRSGEPRQLDAGGPDGPLRGRVAGLAHPVRCSERVVAVLALAWTTPRRGLPERIGTAAMLFAAEIGAALERDERARIERERQALELNDSIVQGLVVAKYSAQRGDTGAALSAIDETLTRARALVSEQLRRVGAADGTIRAGDLERGEASSVNAPGLS